MTNSEFLPIPAWLHEEAKGFDCPEVTFASAKKIFINLHARKEERAAAIIRCMELNPVRTDEAGIMLGIRELLVNPRSQRLKIASLVAVTQSLLKP